MFIYVTLEKKGIIVSRLHGDNDTRKICTTNWDEFEQAVITLCGTTEGVKMMCSSSIDWPQDVTNDRNLINLCNLIRGNDV
jgi:hypothetical protein